VREKTKYAIRQALRILVGMPAVWLALLLFSRVSGINHTPSLFLLISLMIVFGLMAISNFVTMK
jgi:ABC-type microcin C transport system permease subunit YejE